MSLATINTLMDAAAEAVGNGDYATAIQKALGAQVLLAGMPDMTRNAAGGGTQTMSWTRQTVNDFITAARRQQNAAGGIQVADNTYYGDYGNQGT